jgi:hypothetical protein
MDNLDNNYRLEISHATGETTVFAINNTLTIGSDAGLDGHIASDSLAPKHGIFRVKNGVLSFRFLGGNKQSVIDNQVLNHGKMYVLESGDTISIEQMLITVHQGESGNKTATSYENSGVFEQDGTMMHGSLEEMGNDDTLMRIQLDLDDGTEKEEVEEKPQHNTAKINDMNTSDTTLKAELRNIFQNKEANITEKAKTVIFSLRDMMTSKPKKDRSDEMNFQSSTPAKDGPPPPPIQASSATTKAPPPIPSKARQAAGEIKDAMAANPKPLLFLFALLLNIGIFYLAITWSSSSYPIIPLINKHILPATSQVVPFIAPYLKQIPLSIPPIPQTIMGVKVNFILAIYLVYFLWELLFVLVFGRSLGYAIVGIKFLSTSSKVRIKGVIRTIFSIITAPLIILDLPVVWGGRGLKDLMAGIRVIRLPTRGRQWFGILFLAPLLLLLLMISPLIIDSFTREATVVTVESLGERLLKLPKGKAKRHPLPSTLYQMTLAGATDQFTFVPNIELIPGPKKKGSYLKSKMDIYHRANKVPITLLPPKKFELTDPLKILRDKNPLFPYLFPHTTYLLKNPTPNGGLPPTVVKELTKLIPLLITQNPAAMATTLLHSGPITYPLIAAGRKFQQELKIKHIMSLSIMKSKTRTTILKVVSQGIGQKQEIALIPLTSLTTKRYLLSYQTSAASSAEHLMAKIIGHSSFTPPAQQKDANSGKKGFINPFSIIDQLSSLKQDLAARKSFSLETLPYFVRLVKSAQERKDKQFKKRVVKTISTTQKYLAILNKTGKYRNIRKYRAELKRMLKPLQKSKKNRKSRKSRK